MGSPLSSKQAQTPGPFRGNKVSATLRKGGASCCGIFLEVTLARVTKSDCWGGVANFLQTFVEYPPRQKAGSFTIDQVMEKLQRQGGSH